MLSMRRRLARHIGYCELQKKSLPSPTRETGHLGTESRARKSLCLCWIGFRRFDPIAKLSELPDHLPGAALL